MGGSRRKSVKKEQEGEGFDEAKGKRKRKIRIGMHAVKGCFFFVVVLFLGLS